MLRFENLEGVILLGAKLHGGSEHDTTGLLALDTGAGFLALDEPLVEWLGLFEPHVAHAPLDFAERPLPRLEIGELEMDQVSPVLTLDAEIVKQVTDRPVLGLLGERVFENRVVVIDYPAEQLALIPVPPSAAGTSSDASRAPDRASESSPDARKTTMPDRVSTISDSRALLGTILTSQAVSVPFRLLGDGKIVITSRVSNPRPPLYGDTLTLIVDTGATKCILFEDVLEERVSEARRWPSVRGLSAPTLIGPSSARLVMMPSIEVLSASRALVTENVDAAVIEGEMSAMLSRGIGEPVHGLLGYSFLKRYRVTIDYPHRVLWLDPLPRDWDGRRYEYCHVGLQIERRRGAARVVAVAEKSPAAAAGIEAGDEIVAIDAQPANRYDVVAISRLLEGPPGTKIRLTMRRGGSDRTYALKRRRLL